MTSKLFYSFSLYAGLPALVDSVEPAPNDDSGKSVVKPRPVVAVLPSSGPTTGKPQPLVEALQLTIPSQPAK